MILVIPELSILVPLSQKTVHILLMGDTTELTPRPDLHPPLARLPHGAGAVGPSCESHPTTWHRIRNENQEVTLRESQMAPEKKWKISVNHSQLHS